MINRFKTVLDHKIYRGSAPSPKDVLWLKKTLGIKKIISLDKETGDKIARTCKILNINHIIMPLDSTRQSLFNFFKHNLKKMLLDNGPTYIHCLHGKDRTGLIIALFKCKYMGVSPNNAIKEAKSLGFGIGVDPIIINLYEKLIRNCKQSKDINNIDIVSNEREYKSDNRDSFLDEGHQGSFSPYLSKTRQNPIDAVYNYIDDQFPTRENYHIENIDIENKSTNIPLIGLYNNNAGIRGAGPTEPVGGFIYD